MFDKLDHIDYFHYDPTNNSSITTKCYKMFISTNYTYKINKCFINWITLIKSIIFPQLTITTSVNIL